jgi:hypothetical protein
MLFTKAFAGKTYVRLYVEIRLDLRAETLRAEMLAYSSWQWIKRRHVCLFLTATDAKSDRAVLQAGPQGR